MELCGRRLCGEQFENFLIGSRECGTVFLVAKKHAPDVAVPVTHLRAVHGLRETERRRVAVITQVRGEVVDAPHHRRVGLANLHAIWHRT